MKRSVSSSIGLSIIVFLLSLLAGSSAHAQVSKKYELRWGTTTMGGAIQILASAMLEDVKKADPNITGSTIPSVLAASIMGLHQGKFNIVFSQSDMTADAWEGESFFKAMGPIRNIRALTALYPQGTHIVVGAKSGITRIEQLKGKRVSPAAKGLSNDLEAQRLLKLYGMSYNDVRVQFLSFEDSATQFIDGHLDALLYLTVPFPFAPVMNVGSHSPIRLTSIPDDKVAQLTKFRGVEAYTLPADLYKGIDYPVKGIATRSHFLVRDDMPDELAYAIVKSIAENFSRYPIVLKSMSYAKLEDLPKDIGIPFHAGALKYYKERGWVK
ncbi:MAG: TAXI family TRAP transporter solute-binding subunit [Syntrophales bacterium LBB04]|nr:TAXI family TRAP transporter solute-binding subunit [Syntrophales bacterium LBB04]